MTGPEFSDGEVPFSDSISSQYSESIDAFDAIIADGLQESHALPIRDLTGVRRLLLGAITEAGGQDLWQNPSVEQSADYPKKRSGLSEEQLESLWRPLDTPTASLEHSRTAVREASARAAAERVNTILRQESLTDDEWLEGLDCLIELDKAPRDQGVCLGDNNCTAQPMAGVADNLCAPDALMQLAPPEDEDSEESNDDLETLIAEYKLLLNKHYDGELRALSQYERLLELAEQVRLDTGQAPCTINTCERPGIQDFPACETHNAWGVTISWRKLSKAVQSAQDAWESGRAA